MGIGMNGAGVIFDTHAQALQTLAVARGRAASPMSTLPSVLRQRTVISFPSPSRITMSCLPR